MTLTFSTFSFLRGLVFFITGVTLSTRALINQAFNFKLHIATQAISFVVFPGFVFGIVKAVIMGGEGKIDVGVLAGLVTMGVLPTTIASNVAMTRNAGGSVEAATAEVVVGNVIGKLDI
jgi:solute carrier family 10 (sodium/bile acid cotransporter), member 7